MDKSECPICRKKFRDILKHFALAHDIRNMNYLVEEIEKVQRTENKKIAFRNYVEDLKSKRREGIISADDYRKLVMKWAEEHKEV